MFTNYKAFRFVFESRTEIARESFIQAVFVLDKTYSYKWYSSRLIFPRINGPSKIIPHVNTEILNITDKDELNYWLRKFFVEV